MTVELTGEVHELELIQELRRAGYPTEIATPSQEHEVRIAPDFAGYREGARHSAGSE